MAVRCEECDGICILEDPQEVGAAIARCTHCGHRFDISRGAYPRWLVVTPTGEELVFETIGELKGAIDERVGATPPRPPSAAPRKQSMPPRRVLPSVPPMSLEGTPRPSQSFVVPLTPSEAALIAAERAERGREITGSERLRSTPPVRSSPPRSPLPPRSSLPPPPDEAYTRSSLPPPTRPVRHAAPGSPDLSDAMRFANREVTARPPPRSTSVRPDASGDGIGWGLPAALVAALAAVGYVLFVPDAGSHPDAAPVGVSSTVTTAATPKTDQLVLDGEIALSEGNLEAATEAFAKASALGDASARLAIDRARLAAVRADIAWLKLRALPPDAAEEIRATRQMLSELTWKAREAVETALTVSANEPSALRVKVDVLRIAGEIEVARGLVPRVVASLGAEPETAYVLAAIDLAHPGAVPTSVIDRLHIAALAEGGLGRARALLVYALTRNGDEPSAQRELRALQASPRPHPASSALASIVAAMPAGKADPGTKHGPAAATAAASAETNGKGELSAQDLLRMANEAKRGGDLSKARGLYVATLSRNPGDSEALSGLGDTAKAEGDRAGAESFYKSAIAVNPNYLPSQMGLADLLWESGDRVEAQRRYQAIVDRFPPSIVPERARQRALR